MHVYAWGRDLDNLLTPTFILLDVFVSYSFIAVRLRFRTCIYKMTAVVFHNVANLVGRPRH